MDSASTGPPFRTRRRPILFGNPGLGTYKGDVYTVEETAFEQKQQQVGIGEDDNKVECMVAMIDVPPEQVPEGILNLARSHRPWILYVRIVITDDDDTTETTTQNDSDNEKDEEEDDDGNSRTYLVLFQMTTQEAADTFCLDLDGRPYTFLDESVTCRCLPVIAVKGHDGVSLLNPMFAPSTQNKNNQEDFNCAVCLEHMINDDHHQQQQSNTGIFTTVCNHTFHLDCILQCQDSPCPVCRYDHSGLNEALSQCHICGTTEHNYVCLICGVVSCVSSNHDDSTTTSSSTQHFHTSHAAKHYDETLHAYALDTQTQHVWDFAGQGYVHRLLQNKQDGKLVEVSDPYSTASLERTLSPGLSQTQENEVVHRKLEGFASQYYTLLKSQLEQQRIFYEGRLQELRREYSSEQSKRKQRKNENPHLTALKQERNQLKSRLHSIKKKSSKVHEDVKFLKSMNESLEANIPQLELKIKQAQKDRNESKEMIQKYLPALEEKVTTLMLQLEEQSNTADTNEGES